LVIIEIKMILIGLYGWRHISCVCLSVICDSYWYLWGI